MFLSNLPTHNIYRHDNIDNVIEYDDPVGESKVHEYRNNCWFGPEECAAGCIVEKLANAVDNERSILREKFKGFTCARFKDETWYHNINKKIHIDIDNFRVSRETIQINSFPIDFINFASCQCDVDLIEGEAYGRKEKAVGYVLPNIKYSLHDFQNCGKSYVGVTMSFDIFKNNFIYSREENVIQPYTVFRRTDDNHSLENHKTYDELRV